MTIEKQIKKFIKTCEKEKNKIKNEYYNFYEKMTMMKKVIKFKNDIWLPNADIQMNKINFGSSFGTCFDINESHITNNNYIEHSISFDEYKGELLKAKKIILLPNEKQKRIINNWIEAYRQMYNETLKYIKNEYMITKKFNTNHINLRSKLKKKRDLIVSKSGNKNEQIKVHDIDFAIKLACSNYKSAITNRKLKNIKKFRIRYWKKNKENQILDLEKNDFESGSIRKKVLGEVFGYYDKKEKDGKPNKYNFSDIKKESRLIYKKEKYILHVTEDVHIMNTSKGNDIISIDPDLRTFLTGLTENKTVEIGTNIKKKLDIYLNKIQETKNKKEIPKKIKKR